MAPLLRTHRSACDEPSNSNLVSTKGRSSLRRCAPCPESAVDALRSAKSREERSEAPQDEVVQCLVDRYIREQQQVKTLTDRNRALSDALASTRRQLSESRTGDDGTRRFFPPESSCSRSRANSGSSTDATMVGVLQKVIRNMQAQIQVQQKAHTSQISALQAHLSLLNAKYLHTKTLLAENASLLATARDFMRQAQQPPSSPLPLLSSLSPSSFHSGCSSSWTAKDERITDLEAQLARLKEADRQRSISAMKALTDAKQFVVGAARAAEEAAQLDALGRRTAFIPQNHIHGQDDDGGRVDWVNKIVVSTPRSDMFPHDEGDLLDFEDITVDGSWN